MRLLLRYHGVVREVRDAEEIRELLGEKTVAADLNTRVVEGDAQINEIIEHGGRIWPKYCLLV